MKKRLLSTLCALALCLGLLSLTALAVNGILGILEGRPSRDLSREFVLYVSKEALLGCVIPAVSSPAGHGPAQLPALHQLDEL